MSRRRNAVAGLALLTQFVVAGCGAGNAPTSPPATAIHSPTAAAHAWTATTPDGWQVNSFSDAAGAWLRSAPTGVDLISSPSSGPLLTVSPLPAAPPNAQLVMSAIGTIDIVGQAVTTPVVFLGRPAVSVEWTESGLFNSSGPAPDQTFRDILVDFGGGQAFEIELQAPATDWTASAPTLQQVADSLAYR